MRVFLIFFMMIQVTMVQAREYYPDHASIQYAGNIGFISIGGGYSFFDKQLDLDVFYGYVPESLGGLDIHTLSFKANYTPWKIQASKHIKVYPLNLGLALTYNFGDRYFLIQPDRYPDGYYKSNATYFTFYLGTSVQYTFNKKSFFISSIELYTEVGTVDKYLRDYFYSALEEYYIGLGDIINISLGFRVYF